MNADLAREAGCERATIGQYLSLEKPKKLIDAMVLLPLCDALWVTPYWLVLGEGTIDDVERNKIPMQDLRNKETRRGAVRT